MHISSLLIHAIPARAVELQSAFALLPGVEIHATTDQGVFVVTVETDTDDQSVATFDKINLMPGVLSTSLVYHRIESDPEKEF